MKKALRKVTRENPTTTAVGFLVVGAAAAIGLTWWLVERTAKAAPAASNSTAQNIVNVQPGSTTIAPAKGSQVAFYLPAAAKLDGISVGGKDVSNNIPDSNPIVLSFTDDTQVTISWTDSKSTAQTTVVNVVPPGS